VAQTRRAGKPNLHSAVVRVSTVMSMYFLRLFLGENSHYYRFFERSSPPSMDGRDGERRWMVIRASWRSILPFIAHDQTPRSLLSIDGNHDCGQRRSKMAMDFVVAMRTVDGRWIWMSPTNHGRSMVDGFRRRCRLFAYDTVGRSLDESIDRTMPVGRRESLFFLAGRLNVAASHSKWMTA